MLNFPDSPVLDQEFVTSKVTFIWKDAPGRWRRQVAVPLSLLAISPDRGPVNNAATAVRVYGSGFTAASYVHWGAVGQIATTFVSEIELRVTAPSSAVAEAVGVWVFEGTASTPEDVKYTYEGIPLTLVSLTPDWGLVNADQGIVVRGTGFSPNTHIWFNGYEPPKTYVGPEQIDLFGVWSPTALVAPVYAVDGGNTSNILEFEFLLTAPPVLLPIPQSLTPASIVQGTSAANLTVNGQNFENGDRIVIDGVAQATTFVSATQLRTNASYAAPFSIPTALVNVERSVSPDLTLAHTAAPGSVDIDSHIAPGAWPHSAMNSPPYYGNCYCYLPSGGADSNCVVHMDGTPYPSWPDGGDGVWFTPDYKPGQDPATVWRPFVTVVKNGVPSSSGGVLVVGGT